MTESAPALVAIEPKRFAEYEAAVEFAGGRVVELSKDVGALIWTDYGDPQGLKATLTANPQITWVQLPFAGVDAFADVLDMPVRFTSAKGSFAKPVAEHAMALSLALGRAIPERVRATTWGKKFAASFYGSNIVIVGAGGIVEELLKFLSPYQASITVVRRSDAPMPGATSTIKTAQLNSVLPEADLVIIAAALTGETRNLFDAKRFALMKPTAYLVNIARGAIVDTDALVEALNGSVIAGAAVDVTYPEPLPDGHPLWSARNVIITPHTADTKPLILPLFAARIVENVEAYQGQGNWVGVVDPQLGY